MATSPPHARDLPRLLRAELARQNIGVRTLARRIDPENVERARRSLYNWLNGEHVPNAATRNSVADALGVPRDTFEVEDEEPDPAVRELADAIASFVDSRLPREVVA